MNLRIFHVQALFGIIFVEDVFRIAPVVQESEWYGGFPVGEDIDMVCGNIVLAHEVEDDIAHVVVARFTDKADGNADTSQWNDAVEYRTARNGRCGLSATEYDVQYGFSYTYYFTHNDLDFSPR